MEDAVVVGLFFLIIGLSCIIPVISIALYRWSFRQRDQVIETDAYVVDHKVRGGHYHPIIEFETEDGKKHRYMSKVGTKPPRLRVGTYATIYYLQSDPRRYQIKAGTPLKIMAYAFIIFGVIFSSAGLLSLLGMVEW